MNKFILTTIILFQTNLVMANNEHNHDMNTNEHKMFEHSEKHLKGVPIEIKNYFKNSEVSFVHKFLTEKQMNNIEKYSGIKPDNYFHTFIAIGKNNGKKVQLGAGTLIKIKDSKNIELGIIYDNNLNIKEIISVKNANQIKSFLNQFKGKNHDSKFVIGKDIKYIGNELKLANKIISAIKVDTLTIQELWGKAHKH